ncbi:MAG: rhomboid family intramembrane serine protease [Bacteroidia bacterium]|nr:rhomboid family intramembrane serine protease [Bacteroidia bacterium]
MYSSLFQQWIGNIRRFFASRNLLSRLILINMAVWILLLLAGSFLFLFQSESGTHEVVRFLAVPADLQLLLQRPWTLLTYMFLHERFWHIFFNMYMLYFSGKIFLEYLTERHLLQVYLIGGVAGAILYILAYNTFPVFAAAIAQSAALGASASVLAILIAIAAYVPDYNLNLAFFGPVKLKYVALVFILIDLLSIQSGNAGGHIAHLGGALAGFLFIALGKQSATTKKNTFRLHDLFSSIRKKQKHGFKEVHRNRRPLTDEEYNLKRMEKQKEIDNILDKIAKSGYESLSKQEKETLFKQSKP